MVKIFINPERYCAISIDILRLSCQLTFVMCLACSTCLHRCIFDSCCSYQFVRPCVDNHFVGYNFRSFISQIICLTSGLFTLFRFRCTFAHVSCRNTRYICAKAIFQWPVFWLFSLRANNVIPIRRHVCNNHILVNRIADAERLTSKPQMVVPG